MVCFDTSPLIWAVQKVASPNWEHLVPRMAHYVAKLRDAGIKVIIPSPILSEFLIRLPAQQRKASILERHFQVYSFDPQAAEIAARLQSNTTKLKQIRDEFNLTRQCLKVDAMIVATAIACGATKIITENLNTSSPWRTGRFPSREFPNWRLKDVCLLGIDLYLLALGGRDSTLDRSRADV